MLNPTMLYSKELEGVETISFEGQYINVIIVSAEDVPNKKEEGWSDNPNDFLSKELDVSESNFKKTKKKVE